MLGAVVQYITGNSVALLLSFDIFDVATVELAFVLYQSEEATDLLHLKP